MYREKEKKVCKKRGEYESDLTYSPSRSTNQERKCISMITQENVAKAVLNESLAGNIVAWVYSRRTDCIYLDGKEFFLDEGVSPVLVDALKRNVGIPRHMEGAATAGGNLARLREEQVEEHGQLSIPSPYEQRVFIRLSYSEKLENTNYCILETLDDRILKAKDNSRLLTRIDFSAKELEVYHYPGRGYLRVKNVLGPGTSMVVEGIIELKRHKEDINQVDSILKGIKRYEKMQKGWK